MRQGAGSQPGRGGPGATTGSFTTSSSPGEPDSSPMSVSHNFARNLCAQREFFFLCIFSTILLEHQEEYLASLAVSFFSGFCVTGIDKPLILPDRNNHKDFLKQVCDTDQAKLLVFLSAPVIAPSTTTACLPHAKFLFKHSCNDDLTHRCKMRS